MTEKFNSSYRPGYVYILTNDSMPGLVKIGRTERNVDQRASELWQTGVPSKFEVYCAFKTQDCVQLEAYAHAALSDYRTSRLREFFMVDPDTAHDAIQFWIERQAEDYGARYLGQAFAIDMMGDSMRVPVHVCPDREVVSGGAIYELAKITGQDARTIADAVERLTADDIRPALIRAMHDQREEQERDLQRAGIPECDWGLMRNE